MKLYRYRPPSEYVKNEIVKGEIFFSPMASLNDFYDGYYQHSPEGGVEKHIEMLRKMTFDHAREVLKRGPNYTNEVQENLEKHTNKDMYQWAYSILNSPGYFEESIKQLRIDFKNNPEKIKETVEVQNKNANLRRNKTSICCLSKKKLCMSMFGYYADDGKGVMLEYEKIEDKVKDVVYLEKLPIIDIDTPFDKGIEMQVLSKLDCWSHEQEVRGYIYDQPSVQTNHGLKITAVYLGPRIDDQYSNDIQNWSKQVLLPIYRPVHKENGHLEWEGIL